MNPKGLQSDLASTQNRVALWVVQQIHLLANWQFQLLKIVKGKST
jgi:hypothetical protein